MVRVEYEHICDVCGTQIGMEGFTVKLHPYVPIQQPNFRNGCYYFDGVQTDLCPRCAEPVNMARKLVGVKINESGKND